MTADSLAGDFDNDELLYIRKFSRGFFFSQLRGMRSFVKINPSQNGEITLSFTGISQSCHSRDFLACQICLYTPFAKINSDKNFRIKSKKLRAY